MAHSVEKTSANEILHQIRKRGECPPLDFRVLANSNGLSVFLALPRGKANWNRLTVVFASYPSCVWPEYRFEFRRAVVQSGQPAVFVFDHSLRWYVEAQTYDRVCQILTDQMAALGVSDIVTIGNSMGAYGALAYAQDVPVSYALVIATRGSIGASGIADPRYQRQLHTQGLALRAPDLRRALKGVQAGAMIHGTRGPDRLHLPALRARSAVDHWIAPGQGHFITKWMKQNRILFPVVASALRADDVEVNRLLQTAGAIPRESVSASVRLAGLYTLDRVRSVRHKIKSGFLPDRVSLK